MIANQRSAWWLKSKYATLSAVITIEPSTKVAMTGPRHWVSFGFKHRSCRERRARLRETPLAR